MKCGPSGPKVISVGRASFERVDQKGGGVFIGLVVGSECDGVPDFFGCRAREVFEDFQVCGLTGDRQGCSGDS